MLHFTRINRVMDRIRLEGEARLGLPALAREAGLSLFHFHRIFKQTVGETAWEFSSRTRLVRSARMLRQWKGGSLLDLALLSGFNSASDFSRVFRRHYRIAPRDVLRGEPLCLNPSRALRARRIQWLSDNPPRSIRENRVQNVGPLDVIYRRVYSAMEDSEAVKRALREIYDWAIRQGRETPPQIVGICWDDFDLTTNARFVYDAGVIIPAGKSVSLEPWMGRVRLPSSRYAIFDFEGDIGDEEDAFDYALHPWLQAQRLLTSPLPCLELFLDERSLWDWNRLSLRLLVPVSSPAEIY